MKHFIHIEISSGSVPQFNETARITPWVEGVLSLEESAEIQSSDILVPWIASMRDSMLVVRPTDEEYKNGFRIGESVFIQHQHNVWYITMKVEKNKTPLHIKLVAPIAASYTEDVTSQESGERLVTIQFGAPRETPWGVAVGNIPGSVLMSTFHLRSCTKITDTKPSDWVR